MRKMDMTLIWICLALCPKQTFNIVEVGVELLLSVFGLLTLL